MANQATIPDSDKAYANFLHAVSLFRQERNEESLEDAVSAYRWLLTTEMEADHA